MTQPIEPEIAAGRRAFPKAQQLLAGVALRRLPTHVTTGWHGTRVDRESGAFALVRTGAGLDDLIGETLHVIYRTHDVYVYVLGARDVPADLSLTRRAFLALAPPSSGHLPCTVEVVA